LQSDEYAYGFKNMYKDVFKGQEQVLKNCSEFNPIEVKIKDRMRAKFVAEDDCFDPERYAYDNYDNE
jgi:hypothetical protein